MRWLLLFLVACGDGSNAPDAAIPNTIDAAPDAPVVGTVTVKHFNPPPGARAIFLDASDHLIADRDLASGEASAEMMAGGSANVFLPSPQAGAVSIASYLDVVPGDVYVNLPPPIPNTTENVTITVPAVAGATQYAVTSSCIENSATNVTNTIIATLHSCGATADFEARVTTPSGTSTLVNLAVAKSSTITLAGAYTPVKAATMMATNIPADVTSGSMSTSIVVGNFGLAPNLELNFTTGATQTMAGSLPEMAGTTSFAQLLVTSAAGQQYINVRSATTYAPVIDAAVMVPYATAATIDVPTSRIVWTATGTQATSFAGAYARNRNIVTTAFQADRFVFGASKGSLRIPQLPAPYADYNIGSTTTSTKVTQARLIQTTDIATVRQGTFAAQSPSAIGTTVFSVVDQP